MAELSRARSRTNSFRPSSIYRIGDVNQTKQDSAERESASARWEGDARTGKRRNTLKQSCGHNQERYNDKSYSHVGHSSTIATAPTIGKIATASLRPHHHRLARGFSFPDFSLASIPAFASASPTQGQSVSPWPESCPAR